MPVVVIMDPVPVRDVLGMTVVVVSLVDMGPPRTSPVGVGRSDRGSVMAIDRFCRNAVGPPEWECEAMGSVVWVKCATSAESVFKLSIAASSVMDISS